jgi:predicted phosphodiesterase
VSINSSRIAFISDVHGNSPALEAVLRDIEHYNVEELIMLGDIVNGIDPHGCVDFLRAWAVENQVKLTGIRGNAESYLLTPDRDSLKEYGIEWLPPLGELIDWYQAHLTEEDMSWLHSLPVTKRWRNALLVHDSPCDRLAVHAEADPRIKPEHREWFYHGKGLVWDMEANELAQVCAFMDEKGYERIFCGHTHWPFILQQGGKSICNVGSAGAPLDADWRPAWVLFEQNDTGEEHLSTHRVEYDLARINKLFDEKMDYPDLEDPPGKREAFKKWYATGLFWKVHIPGILPPEKDRAG